MRWCCVEASDDRHDDEGAESLLGRDPAGPHSEHGAGIEEVEERAVVLGQNVGWTSRRGDWGGSNAPKNRTASLIILP